MRSITLFKFMFILLLAGASVPSRAQQRFSESHKDPYEFVSKVLRSHPVVAIGDLPGCEQLYGFLRSFAPKLIESGDVEEIIVDFGNPRLQPVIDRYVLDGEMVPRSVLRSVWDDTTRSLNLTWDSPVYEEFLDSVRAANLSLPRRKRVRLVLSDAPIDWLRVRSVDDLKVFTDELREQTLAKEINEVLSENKRALVIAMSEHLVRKGNRARSLVELEHPGKMFSIVTQGRFGAGEQYKEIEADERLLVIPSVISGMEAALSSVPIDLGNAVIPLKDVADAILYIGPSDSLTRLYPWASIFQDSQYWNELNRRSQIVNGQPFDLSQADYDLRGKADDVLAPIDRSAHRPAVACCGTTMVSLETEQASSDHAPRAASEAKRRNGVEFILAALDEHPMVGLGDDHMGLEFYQFLDRLLRDPRLPGKVNDIVVEFGNPRFQSAIDRYVVECADVPRDQRKGAWQYAAEGWYVANSPVYEHFFDTVRAVNQGLPFKERIRVVLGDAAVDFQEFVENPALLMKFARTRETPEDPRELSLGASVNRVLDQGRRGLMICGNGHLQQGHRPGNAREIIDREHPGDFYLINSDPCSDSVARAFSVVEESPTPYICLGPSESLTAVRPSPLIFRDALYFRQISWLHEALGQGPLDLAEWKYEYRGRYFQAALPFKWPRGVMQPD